MTLLKRLRFERWNNGYQRVTDWNGKGQPTQSESVPPTEWFVGLSHSDHWECFEVHKFPTKKEREIYIQSKVDMEI